MLFLHMHPEILYQPKFCVTNFAHFIQMLSRTLPTEKKLSGIYMYKRTVSFSTGFILYINVAFSVMPKTFDNDYGHGIELKCYRIYMSVR